MAVWVDTAALLALVNRGDALHARAVEVNSQLAAARETLVTTDWVLTEFLSVASRQPLRDGAVAIVHRLQQSSRCELIPATREGWTEAFELFSSRSDKSWSLVDCSSILLCQSRGIRDVFSADHHFVQAGLMILLP